ncbi:hypothetical protein ORI20_21965 [Mycobacterium sp. CVI_P3]|uniref:RES domain-containing protein n=1 Tax=Mycobacterium pinniadriaticum TaxID=2994102 RepID=A0ABT3SJ37_9MYCO|nr:hypothetical protein [Mycobacterium pinniadriaticum]MCX2932941.1 hypothetical protein [Mycobacterium pinniadriaticum]MCX2939387.1 hypothetical protein [Mycobacterium pinniadriaticum]
MTTISTPQSAARAVAAHPTLLAGTDDRVSGFGIMGLPFDTGHYLAYRDFPASSFSPAYRSVWHRDPAGLWTFYSTTPAEQSCSRYFSSATTVPAVQCQITMSWMNPWSLTIAIPGLLDWTVEMTSTPATRAVSRVGRAMPEWAWASRSLLAGIGRVAGSLLGAGEVRLAGSAPNGQGFRVAPRQIWAVRRSRAILDGTNLGTVAPLATQSRLADFRLPQRGLCVIGTARFDSFDPRRHIPAQHTAATEPRNAC